MQSAVAVLHILKRLGTPKKAKASAWFFKTQKGQYGYGDVFYGVTVPEQRQVAKEFSELPLPEIKRLLESRVHEARLTALIILVGQYQKADVNMRAKIVAFYVANRKFVNNWDLVDSSAGYILGNYILDNNRKVLYTLARSKNLWDRRIAIVATQALISAGQYSDTLRISEILLRDSHDLIQKAVGWMLREVGKRSLAAEEKFLKKYAARMPRTMLRYAIERFPEKKRNFYLKTAVIK